MSGFPDDNQVCLHHRTAACRKNKQKNKKAKGEDNTLLFVK
jgi:hypothetical protein